MYNFDGDIFSDLGRTNHNIQEHKLDDDRRHQRIHFKHVETDLLVATPQLCQLLPNRQNLLCFSAEAEWIPSFEFPLDSNVVPRRRRNAILRKK